MRVSLTGSWTKVLNHYSIPVPTWELATMENVKSLLCSYHKLIIQTLLINKNGIDTQNYINECVMCEVGEGAKFYHLLHFVKICRSARDYWVRWGSQGWDFCSSYVVPWNTPLRRGLRDWKDEGCDE